MTLTKAVGGWLASAVLALGLIASATIYRYQRLSIEPSQITLPADGAEHDALRIHPPASWLGLGSTVTEDTGRDQQLRLLESKDPSGRTIFEGVLLAPVTPGHLQLHLLWRHRTFHVPVSFVLDPSDSFGDGTPDFLRLHTAQDRQAFPCLVHLHRGRPGRPAEAACRDRRLRRAAPLRLSRSPARPQ